MSDLDRFLAKVDRTGECWVWTAGRYGNGYGEFWLEGRLRLAHRAAWMLLIGPIPSGAQVLHRCDNRPCVNPDHLFLGTQADNLRDMYEKGRGNLPAKRSRQQTHCRMGHPLSGDNLYVRPSDGRRRCRACQKAYHDARYRRLKEVAE